MAMNMVQAHPSSVPAGLPTYVDWEEHNILGPIRQQGPVDSCWAVVTCQAIEALYNLHNPGAMMQLSPKHLVDCVRPDETEVYRSFYADPFNFAVENGIRMEQAYPYHPSKHRCPSVKLPVMKIRSYNIIPDYDDVELMRAVSIQPVAVAIQALQEFYNYNEGIYTGFETLQLHPIHRKPNHAILLTGYGNVGGTDVWKIRNSHGINWGMEGKAYIVRNSSHNSSYPNLLTYRYIPKEPYGF